MKLENLATVMTLYSRRTFSKESFQWTKCVVKYLYDAYSHLSHNMLAFLVEVIITSNYSDSIKRIPPPNIIKEYYNGLMISKNSNVSKTSE